MQIAVPEGLTVRVINNISKQAEVKQRFYDAFKNEGYPESFPFDQKVCSFPLASNPITSLAANPHLSANMPLSLGDLVELFEGSTLTPLLPRNVHHSTFLVISYISRGWENWGTAVKIGVGIKKMRPIVIWLIAGRCPVPED